MRLLNFKGVRSLTITFSPSVNFLIAPNGHGKSSVLEAIALCLGSSSSELSQLIYEGEQQAEAELSIFDTSPSVVLAKIGQNGTRSFYHNGSPVVLNYVQRLAQKYKIRIDNPFISMMQHSAQRVVDASPFERL